MTERVKPVTVGKEDKKARFQEAGSMLHNYTGTTAINIVIITLFSQFKIHST